jgi:hypothetical protein
MFISECEDKSLKLGTTTPFKYGAGLEKNKLFIANLPFSVDKAQLETIFQAVCRVDTLNLKVFEVYFFFKLVWKVETSKNSDVSKW